MSEAVGITYGISEKDGRFAPFRTGPENDVIQTHTDGLSEMFLHRIVLVVYRGICLV